MIIMFSKSQVVLEWLFLFLNLLFVCIQCIDLFLIFKDTLFISEKGEREGEEHQCAWETSLGCLSPAHSWWPGPQPRYMPWPGIEPGTSQFSGLQPTHGTTTVNASVNWL